MPVWLSITVQLLAVAWGIVAAVWVNRLVHVEWQYGGERKRSFMNANFRLLIAIFVFMAATSAVFPLLLLLNAAYP